VWNNFIPTARKIEYINHYWRLDLTQLILAVLFQRKPFPQMADIKEVIQGISARDTGTKLLAIVANVRGAEEASSYDQITYLGFPFSVSETFQQRIQTHP
jgi:hydroxymethylglutaryl-CoA lyase